MFLNIISPPVSLLEANNVHSALIPSQTRFTPAAAPLSDQWSSSSSSSYLIVIYYYGLFLVLAKLSRTLSQCTKYPLSIASHRFVLFGQVSKYWMNNGRKDMSWMESVQLRGSFSRECEKPKTYWLFAHPPLLEIILPEELLIKLQATYHLEWMACTWFCRLFPASNIFHAKLSKKKKKSCALLKTAAKRKRTYVSVLNALF